MRMPVTIYPAKTWEELQEYLKNSFSGGCNVTVSVWQIKANKITYIIVETQGD